MANVTFKVHKSAFNEVYYEFLRDYSHRYNVYYGSAGSGKSVFVIQKCILKGLRDKRKFIVVRKVAATLRVSIFQEFITQLERMGLLALCKVSESYLRILLPNGTEFKFMGVDDPEKLKSISGITDIIIEEATEISLDEFTQLDLRLRARVTNPQIYLMFNPVSKANWCYKRWYATEQDEDTFRLKTTYKENAFLTQKYINTLERMKETNPTYYKIYALGDFATLDKLVFTNVMQAPCQASNDNRFVSIDWGFTNDPTAIIVGNVDLQRKQIAITDEVYRRGMFVDEIATEIKRMGVAHLPVYCDSAEPRSIADLRRNGINAIAVKKGMDSVMHGIVWLQQFNITVDPTCPKMWEELQNYSYKKDKSGEYTNQPVDNWNHAIDSLRYGTEQYREDNRLTSMPKHLLGL